MGDVVVSGEGAQAGESGGLSPAERALAYEKSLLPANYSTGDALPFDPKLVFELAVGVDKPSTIFAKYGYSPEAARELIEHPVFKPTLLTYKKEVEENGLSFRAKARLQAESMLSVNWMMIHDPSTPASVRADLIKWTAKMGGLEPDPKNAPFDGVPGGGGRGFTLNINIAGTTAAVSVKPDHVTIDGERLE